MIVVTVARRPLSEGTVASNALVHGTGAFNIDGARIAPVDGESIGPGSWSDPSKRGGEVGGDLGFTGNSVAKFQQAQAESVERANRLGRWPANLVFEHLAGCDAGCVTGCPVAALDGQSGESASSAGTLKYKRADTSGWKERGGSYTPGREWEAEGYGDTGGASRYFKQIRGHGK